MTNETRQRTLYIVADIMSTTIAILLFNVVRSRMLSPELPTAEYLQLPMVVAGTLLFPLMMMAIYFLSGFYNSVIQKSRLHDLIITFWSCISGMLVIVFMALIDDMTTDRTRDYSLFAILLVLLMGCVWPPRLIIANMMIAKLRCGKIFKPIAIVGYGADAVPYRKILSIIRPTSGMRATVAMNLNGDSDNTTIAGLRAVNFEELSRMVAAHEIKSVILLPPPSRNWNMTLETLKLLMPLDVTVLTPHDYSYMPMVRQRHLDVASEPLIPINRPYMSASTTNIKRVSDVAISILSLAVLALPMAAIAAAIKFIDKHSPIYSQRRIGRGGQPFNIYKFRTMVTDAEADGVPQLATTDDARITPLGNFLRKYRLDELPQFWNVIRGDMSIVGPRPERQYFINEIVKRAPSYILLHQVRPGITSWGMVKYGYASSVDQMIERMRYDMLYVENISLQLDIKIIFYTFHTVITGKGL